MTAPSIAGTTTADVQDALASGGAATSAAINLPTSHAANDVLVLIVSQKNGGAASTVTISTTGTAWTQKSTVQTTTGAVTEIWWVRDGGSEPASVTVNWTVAGRASLKMVRITGAKTSGDPFDVFGSWSSAATSTSQVAPTVTTTQTDTLLLSAVAANTGQTGTVAQDAAMRELGAEVISSAVAGGSTVDLADETRASSGATGTRTWTFGASSSGAALLMAIAPVVGGSTVNADAAATGTATITSTATRVRPLDAAVTGTATIAATATRTFQAAAALTGTATITATATVTAAGTNADAAVNAVGTITATVNVTRSAAAAVNGVATITATATVVHVGTGLTAFVDGSWTSVSTLVGGVWIDGVSVL